MTTRKGCEQVHDPFDVTLEDQDLLREVELTTNLIIAASEVDRALTEQEIDAILEVAAPDQAGQPLRPAAPPDQPDPADG